MPNLTKDNLECEERTKNCIIKSRTFDDKCVILLKTAFDTYVCIYQYSSGRLMQIKCGTFEDMYRLFFEWANNAEIERNEENA